MKRDFCKKEVQGSGRMACFFAKDKKQVEAKRTLLQRGKRWQNRCPLQSRAKSQKKKPNLERDTRPSSAWVCVIKQISANGRRPNLQTAGSRPKRRERACKRTA